MTTESTSPGVPAGRARALVVGYASLDRAIRVDRCPGPGTTSVIRRIVDASRRPGGIAHTALALASGEVDVTVVTSVGNDGYGKAYVEALESGGCDTSRVLVRGDRSPSTDLLYADDGSTACLFHPGTPEPWPLDDAHIALAAEVDLVVCMVGPAAVTAAILDAVGEETTLAWVIKDDQEALGGGLRSRLSGRAHLIICNRAEGRLIDTSVLGERTMVVQTSGAEPVEVTVGHERAAHPVPPLDHIPIDPTGAGDAFAGGFLAAHLRGATTDEAVAAGLHSSRSLLQSRATEE